MSPSLAWSPRCPSGQSIGLSCCPLQRGGSTLVSLQTSAFLFLGCVVLCQCVSSGVFECSLWTHRSPWFLAGTSGSRSADSRDKPLYKGLCLGWKISQGPQMEKLCLWEFTARTPAAELGWLPQSVTCSSAWAEGRPQPTVLLVKLFSGASPAARGTWKL